MEPPLHQRNHAVRGWRNIAALWRDKKLTDCLVTVENVAFPCHSVILASQSKHLKKILLSTEKNLQNANSMQRKEIKLDFLTADLFKIILDFIYYGEITLRRDQLLPLLLIGSKMEIEGLIEHLLSGVLMETYKKIDKEWFTLIGILEYFREKEEHETVNTIIAFLCRHFRCLKLQPNLSKFHAGCFVALLSKDEIEVDEREIFDTFAAWVEVAGKNSEHIPILLSKIRLENLTLEELSKIVEQKPWLVENEYCQKLILTAYKHKAINGKKQVLFSEDGIRYKRSELLNRGNPPPEKVPPLLPPDEKEKFAEETKIELSSSSLNTSIVSENGDHFRTASPRSGEMMLFGGRNLKKLNANNVIYKFSEHNDHWEHFSEFPSDLMAFQVVKLGEYCYVIGGCRASREDSNYSGDYEDSRAPEVNVSSKTYRYDVNEDEWTTLENMPIGRYNHSCVLYQKKIIVIGGQDGHNKLVKPVQMFDPENNSWSTIGEMKWSRIHFACSLYLDSIWLIGGIKKIDVGPISVVESFNLETEEWHRQPPLPFPVMNSAAVAWRDQLFNIGGRERLPNSEYVSTDKISMYKAMDNIWQVIVKISVPRHNLSAVIANERIYILGGEQRISYETGSVGIISVECFDLESERLLSPIPPLSRAKSRSPRSKHLSKNFLSSSRKKLSGLV
ncbi:Oidioi.mRNA.OKI2018_I69.chr1.g1736.t1.cds [Oikopleura dioica]|uniref:Oidioi.mRNA.OKI2018_I69.chr1.g1736.t1.cds n=1 Tax=Oikopleura dioica TaxID=34765 RepID=A0ABN7SSB4_OIKDI|nr:Oidioi.mRNA.OKI2018_I69.chr1.g1736.t1.cds [Oikopleura dioica]